MSSGSESDALDAAFQTVTCSRLVFYFIFQKFTSHQVNCVTVR